MTRKPVLAQRANTTGLIIIVFAVFDVAKFLLSAGGTGLEGPPPTDCVSLYYHRGQLGDSGEYISEQCA